MLKLKPQQYEELEHFPDEEDYIEGESDEEREDAPPGVHPHQRPQLERHRFGDLPGFWFAQHSGPDCLDLQLRQHGESSPGDGADPRRKAVRSKTGGLPEPDGPNPQRLHSLRDVIAMELGKF